MLCCSVVFVRLNCGYWSVFLCDSASTKYFHSDNLSSAEKMKIELTKVREDFKMSESDCGSARVQGKLWFSDEC